MVRLSNRQYPMLAAFATEKSSYSMTIEQAKQFDQRPFRSMLIQEWIAYVPGKGFRLTVKGVEAWSEFQSTDIVRKDASRPLTRYFDPTAYGLKVMKKAG